MTERLLSIGMPVFNAGKHLAGALDSLLAQDFGAFEVLVCDNASTDDTATICRRYAEQDPRIRYSRNPTNIGAAANFNKVFAESAPHRYFMWAAHDDEWHPAYVRSCIDALEQRAQAVLCVSEIEFIGADGAPAQDLPEEIRDYNRLHTPGLDQRARASRLTERINWYAVYGVIRRDALTRTKLFRGEYGGDILLLMELLLQGETLTLPEKLFRYRVEDKSAAMQVASLSGGGHAVVEKIYTGLASRLLDVVRGADPRIASDLIENMSQGVWREQMINENALQRYRDAGLLGTEIRLRVDRRLTALQAWSIRTAAASRYVRDKPLIKRIKVRTKLALDALGVKRWTFYAM